MTPQQAFDKLCLIQRNQFDAHFTISNEDNLYFHLKGSMNSDTIQMIVRQFPRHYSIHNGAFCVSFT